MQSHLVSKVGAIVILGLLAAACGAPATPGTDTPAADTPAPEATATPTEEPAPKEIPEEARTLIVAVSDDVASFDFNLASNFPRFTETQSHVVGRLIDFGTKTLPDGTVVGDAWSSVPVLAESFEVSEDGLVWTFHLIEGMKHYPSGNPITAYDSEWYYARGPALNVQSSLPVLVGIGPPENPYEGLEALNEHTLRITSERWNTILPGYLPMAGIRLIDSETYKDNATEDDPWATEYAKTSMPSSGPYYIESRVPGEEMVFGASPNWPLEEPFFNRVIFKVIPGSADRVLLLKAGEVDIAQDLTLKEYIDLKGFEGVTVHSSPVGDMVGVLMHGDNAPMDDVRVRQALSYIVPYQDIMDTVYGGTCSPMKAPIPASIPNYDDSFWPYDVSEEEAISKAKALLAEAGYPDGVEFPLSYEMGIAEMEQIATLVQSQAAKAGMTVNIDALPRAAFQEKKQNGQLVAFLDALLPWVPDPGYFLDIFYRCGSHGDRYTGFCDEEVDELIGQASTERDDATRQELYSEAQRIVLEEAPWAWICARNFNAALRDDIGGYVHYTDSLFRYHHLHRELP